MKKVRSLIDIELNEVSLVDKAANKKKFLFFKQEDAANGTKTKPKKLKKKINIVIDSDGTIGGTKITLNKEVLKNLRDFNFSFWNNDDSGNRVNASYSTLVDTKDGFSRSETFYLSKGNLQMNSKTKEQLNEYFGENNEVDFEKAVDFDDVTASIKIVNEYKEDFPDDLKKAVGMLAKQSGFCDTIVSKMLENNDKDKDDKNKVEKAGAKLSKDTLAKIVDALAALKSILPQLKENTEKSDKNDDDTDMAKVIEGLKKSIEEIETKKEDDNKDKLSETIKELTKRLKKVEDTTGVRKSLEDQDDSEEENTDVKWPSILKG